MTILQIPVTFTGVRQHLIDSTLAEHDGRQQDLEDYAGQNGYDLTALRGEGSQKKAKARQ